MAALSSADRQELWAEYQLEISKAREALGLSKADLRAAVDAIDDWLNTNAAALNSAIPQPARGALSTPQKARLLNAVVRQRYLKGA